MSANKNTALSFQTTLWNEVPRVPSSLTAARVVPHYNKLNELTAESIQLLPINAGKDKNGVAKPSLKLLNPDATVAELKTLHKAQGMEMKAYLGAVAMAMVQNPEVVGVAPRLGRKGRVSLVFQKVTPQIDLLTDEELAAEMGQTVAWIKKNRKAKPTTVELDMQAPETPAPKANGKPKVVAPVATPQQ